MDDLPKQAQKIVDAVARNWDPISVKELKEKVRLESKVISAQLRQLQKNQVIEKIETNTKNHLYILKERFWNIWYLMRYGRKFDRERIIWLVKFLECWYSNSELEQKVLDFIGKIKNSEISKSTLEFYSSVYSSIDSLSVDTRINLQESLPSNIAKSLSIDLTEIIKQAEEKVKRQKFDEALKLIRMVQPHNFDAKKNLFKFLLNFPLEDLISFYNNLYNKSKKFDKFVTNDQIILYYSLIVFGIFLGSSNGIPENRHEAIKDFFQKIKNYNLSENLNTSFEVFALNLMLKSFILGNQANIAYEFFNDKNAKN